MAEITFNLEKNEAELILNALAQLPYAQSAGMINKLQQQAQESLAAAEAAASAPPEAPEEKGKK